jgi:DNA-binding transcriptional ArsR family regulator
MDMMEATTAFAALSQTTRLEILRVLIKAGPEGMPSGELGAKLQVRQNTMSANLAVLLNAGLVRNRREGRVIRYFADFEGLGTVMGFLMKDCCGGRPEICGPILDQMSCNAGIKNDL